jgi:universal stress protein A
MSLFKHILAPFDFSKISEEGVRVAQKLAELHDSDLTILHVVQEPTFPSFYKLGALRIYGMVPDTEKLAWRALEKRFGSPQDLPRTTYSVVKGEAGPQIVRTATEDAHDLIVISSHGLTGLANVLLGSVAEKVVRNAECPVLVVKNVEGSAAHAAAEETAEATQ